MNPRLPLIALLIISLTACGSPSTKTAGQSIDDSLITTNVKAAIIADKTASAHDVNVEVYKGRVQLSGFVVSRAAADAAIERARRVGGVKSVIDRMHVTSGDRSVGNAVDDETIKTKLLADLGRDSKVSVHDLVVHVRFGNIILAGFVATDGERVQAENVARKVKGAKDVINDIDLF